MSELLRPADPYAAADTIRRTHADAQDIRTTSIACNSLAVIRTRVAASLPITSPVPSQDAYLLTLHLQDVEGHQYWAGNRRVSSGPLRRGDQLLVDLRTDPSASVTGSFDVLHFYLPMQMLADACSTEGQSFDGLDINRWRQDAILGAFGGLMVSLLDRPGEVAQTVFEEACTAMMWHILGHCRPALAGKASTLPDMLLRRAKEMLAGVSSLQTVAEACDLPLHRFIRSFTLSTGQRPAEWRRARRIEEAKFLLFGTDMTIAEIAMQCGFSDTSHFVRSFSAATGHTPNSWRRARHM